MIKLTGKALKELLSLGKDLVLRDTNDEGTQYVLKANDTSYLAVKRIWDPEHPVAEDGWLDLALVYDIKPQDVNKMDLVKELDDEHQEWLDELEEADLYFNKQ